MRGFLTLVGLIVLGAVGWLLWNIIPASGMFAGLKPKLIDQCRKVDVFPGTEDVTIDPELNVAFISADDRRATFAGKPAQGGVYVLKLDGSDRVMKASPDSFGEFHPHGISLWRGADGRKRLFAINHTLNDGDKVEVFDVGLGGALLHVDTIAFKEMSSPNDIVGVGPRSFYVTNDRGVKEGFMAQIEAYFALPLSSIAYFDGQKGRIAARGLTYANGINVSADGKTLYASEFLGRKVSVYDRDPATGALTKKKSIKVNTGPDNIEVAADGALWIGGHSKVFDFLKHAEDPAAISPSHVIRVNPETGLKEDVLIDVAGTINGSSVGAVWDNTLVVGAVFDGHVMVCPIN
ncbi:MAG: SMP-30/gluconolactonase/LRE family protein [Parvularculaceae bacterium]|nr:SMP-30/gluconolactonase/LRE family protein [Parvularculaceae bacterium]